MQFFIRSLLYLTLIISFASVHSFAETKEELLKNQRIPYQKYYNKFLNQFSNAVQKETPTKRQILKAVDTLGQRLGLVYQLSKHAENPEELELFQREGLDILMQLAVHLHNITRIQKSAVNRSFDRIPKTTLVTLMGTTGYLTYHWSGIWWLSALATPLSALPIMFVGFQMEGHWNNLTSWYHQKSHQNTAKKLMKVFIKGAKKQGLEIKELLKSDLIHEGADAAHFVHSAYQTMEKHSTDPCLKLLMGGGSAPL